MATLTLREEATDLLQRLIRLDTVNPPGNETLAAELLRGYLADSGVAVELYAKVPERANLLARIPGRGEGPRLLLLSHTDTVLADAAEWQLDPWSGELRDGEIWGRGALDMKGQVAANAVAIASLAREGFEPSGDLIFAATADEEVGDDFGLSWLCREHPDAVHAEYCVNEGAGDRIDFGGGRIFYLCSAAEKMSSPFRLVVHGRSGHASMPGIADNALVKAATLIVRLAELRPEPRLEPEVAAFLRLLTGREVGADEALDVARGVHPLAAELIEPLLSLTVSPTIVSASQKRNVIPALCDLICDCRLLPGHDPEVLTSGFAKNAEAACAKLGAKFSLQVDRASPAMELNEPSALLDSARAACRDVGLPDKLDAKPTNTEAGIFARAGVESIVFGPGRSTGNAHCANEHNLHSQLLKAVEFYRALISRLCA